MLLLLLLLFLSRFLDYSIKDVIFRFSACIATLLLLLRVRYLAYIIAIICSIQDIIIINYIIIGSILGDVYGSHSFSISSIMMMVRVRFLGTFKMTLFLLVIDQVFNGLDPVGVQKGVLVCILVVQIAIGGYVRILLLLLLLLCIIIIYFEA